MSYGLVIFDGDDTLWWVEQLYDEALDSIESVLKANDLPSEEWRVLQRRRDLENVGSMGMSPTRFPRSSVEALDLVFKQRGEAPPAWLRQEVEQLSRSVFERKAPLVDGVEEVLSTLAPLYDLALMTKGDYFVQRKRVRESGLGRWFKRICIAPEKHTETFASLARELGHQPSLTWSAGNSLPSDINPALAAGMNAIWIDAHVWEHERRESESVSPNLHEVSDISAIIPILTKACAA